MEVVSGCIFCLTHPSPFTNLQFVQPCLICSSIFDISIEPLPLEFCRGDGDVIVLAHIWKQQELSWKDSRGRPFS